MNEKVREYNFRDVAVKEQIVHSDPEIMGGELVFVGTRVPVYNLFDYLEAGDSLDEFLEQFPSVTREQAVAALELAREAVVGVESGPVTKNKTRRPFGLAAGQFVVPDDFDDPLPDELLDAFEGR
jgi:uncharacterized protein (DUF433 family)